MSQVTFNHGVGHKVASQTPKVAGRILPSWSLNQPCNICDMQVTVLLETLGGERQHQFLKQRFDLFPWNGAAYKNEC